MVITYGGLEFFKIQSGDLTLVFNPVSKESKSGITAPRFKSDIALVTSNHPDFNGTNGLLGKDEKEAFIVSGPGEYEIKEVFIKGFGSNSQYGGKELNNTIYKIHIEDVNICFLGALSDSNLPENILSELEGSEILFVPIGGDGVLNPSEAHKLAVKISPNVIIPMHFGLVGEKDSLQKFLKEEGTQKVEPVDKLTTKKSQLLTQSGEIIVLSSSND
jgi:L-ascorbate metabolism protein UlaG (beta-lactamase superfamily)